MKRIYRKPANAGNSTIVESNNKPSQTQPDMALTVREVMTRFANGTLPDLSRDMEFSEDLPDLRGLDISEKMALRNHGRELIDKEKKRLEDVQKSELPKDQESPKDTESPKDPEPPKNSE